jgi:hypothetical protein
MITFKKLGKYGWLGNQMFQYAFLYAVGKKTEIDIGFDFNNNPMLTKIFNIKAKDSSKIIQSKFLVEKNTCEYIDYSSIENNTDIMGYFQNYKYVKENEIDLKNIFVFNENTYNKCFNFIKEFKNKIKKDLVSIHLRRTDYLKAPDIHNVCDEKYYSNAIGNFSKDNFFVIFTDDPEYAENAFVNIPCIVMNNSTEEDLILMSLCDHNIIANSSYSWWGSWLNENTNKKIIAPKRWYNKIGPKEWENIYRPEMILI